MPSHYVIPEFQKDWFTCPNCWAFAKQNWEKLHFEDNWVISIATCDHCDKFTIWQWATFWWQNSRQVNNARLVSPKISSIPQPNPDLNDDIILDYLEAWNIVDESPRWACALLRLALQKLMVQLGEEWNDINRDIGNLVQNWLNPTIQKALDTVRVVWNESVHPWEIDMKDNKDIAIKLFGLINLIANALITQPKEVEELYYWVIPDSKLEGIENRDNH